jgi:hypothetical protein
MQVDLSRLPAEYRCHVHDCPACRRVVEQLCRLEQLLPQLPVPPSTPQVKSTLIARVIAEAPVPSSRLAALRRLETFEQWLAKTGWKFSAGIAAALLLGFGVWWFHSAQPPATASAPYHRHSLLHAEVQHVSALATADTPAERLRIWTEIVRELNAETALVYSIAPEAEMRSLGQMFDRAVHEGIVRQTAQFPEQFPPQQRQQLLREVAKQLRDISEESERLSAQAPPQSRPVLLQMATTARIGCTHVEALQP